MDKIRKTRFVSALMVAVMLMVTLAACDSGGGGTSNNSGANSGKSNAELLKLAAANMKAAKSYRIDVTAKTGGQDIKMGADLDLGNKKSKVDASMMGQNIVFVAIGDESYASTDGGTTFTKNEAGSSMTLPTDSFTKIWESFKPEEIDKAAAAIKDGTPKDDKVGSDDTRHMTANSKDLGSLSAGTSSSEDAVVDLWVTTGDKPTVRKMKMVGKSNGVDTTAEIEWTKIDQSFTIDAPPVK